MQYRVVLSPPQSDRMGYPVGFNRVCGGASVMLEANRGELGGSSIATVMRSSRV